MRTEPSASPPEEPVTEQEGARYLAVDALSRADLPRTSQSPTIVFYLLS